MPSTVHEVLVELFTETMCLSDLLRVARGGRVPKLVPADPNLTEVMPVELHADGFLVAGTPDRPKGWVILEVQTSVDADKLRTIPLGLEMAQARYRGVRGDVVLVTADDRVARWFDRHRFSYEGPLGTRRALSVVRVDLTRVPKRKLLDARRPHLGLLAVVAHRKGPAALAVAEKALDIAARQPGPWSAWIADAILQVVDAKVREAIEASMLKHGYRTPILRDAYNEGEAKGEAKGIAKGIAKGEARGEARGKTEQARAALLQVLRRRGLELTADQRQRIAAETDLGRLERWLDSAVTAATLAEIFADA